MPPWREIQYQHEVMGKTLDELSAQYGVSASELAYAAETWKKKPVDAKKAREDFEPHYISLELSLITKLQSMVSSITTEEPNAAQQLKQLVECYKILRYGDKDHDASNDVVVNIINSFSSPNSAQPSSSAESIRVATKPSHRNVTTPSLQAPTNRVVEPEVITIDPTTGRILE